MTRLIRRTLLVLGLVLICSAAWAQTVSWMGYTWDTQPEAPYASGSVTVDTATNQLWENAAGAGKIDWLGITPLGQRFAFAELATPISGVASVHAKVYENSYKSQGPSLVIFSSTGKILSVGAQPSVGTSYYYLNFYDGTAWANYSWITRGKTSYSNYLEITYALNGSSGIDITADYTSVPDFTGYTGTYTWSTPTAFDDVSEVWLVQSCSDSYTAGTAKWTTFDMTVVPEPSSFVALLAGLPVIGFALRRRRA